MIRVYILSYSRDAELALMSARITRCALPAAEIYIVDDVNDPCPEDYPLKCLDVGAHYQLSSFPRRGNLNGPDVVRGILDLFCQNARDFDISVKLDSDTAIFNSHIFDQFADKNINFISSGTAKNLIFGCCYAMRAGAAKNLLQTTNWPQIGDNSPEDITIAKLYQAQYGAYTMLIHDPLQPGSRWLAYDWRTQQDPQKYKHAHMITFGNPRQKDSPRTDILDAMQTCFFKH